MSSAEAPGTPCLDDDLLSAYVERRLPADERQRVSAHLAACDGCAKLVVAVMDAASAAEPLSGTSTVEERRRRPATAAPEQIPEGTEVGRYLLRAPLGSGGMGVVYEAEDPDLRRKVALKFLRTGSRVDEAGRARLRLVREAQAMAKLSHPNVVAVYDVGTYEGRVFLAMELVRGETLRERLLQTRTPLEKLALLEAAGRGLAAAHAAGLVHRDFKPENVLIGSDGLVKVTDFGLARTATLEEEDGRATADEAQPLPMVTAQGAIVGTPAYMAPEQFRGSPVDARADQFSFCVVVYEALFGTRPFTPDQLRAGTLPSTNPPRLPGLPRRIGRALQRGLSTDPAQRFPELDALLAAFRPRRRAPLMVAAALGLIALLGAPVAYRAATAPTPCAGVAGRFDEAWGTARAERLRQALQTASPTEGPRLFASAREQLDGYRRSWTGLAEGACRAHLRGEETNHALDLQMDCLDRRRRSVDALVTLFEHADATLAPTLPEAVQHLRNVDSCSHLEVLEAVVPPPEDAATRTSVEAFREKLAQAQALHDSGRYAQGLEVLTAAMKNAQALRYAPAAAEAFNLLGWLKQRLGDAKGAEQARYDAVLKAMAGRDDEVAIMAATELVFTFAWDQARFDAAHYWEQYAQALIDRIGGSAELEGKLASNRGVLALSEGRYADAVRDDQQALALREKVFGPDHLETAKVVENLALTYQSEGELGQAGRLHDRALRIEEHILGPNHPQVAETLVNSAYVLEQQHRFDETVGRFERALQIREATLGPSHPKTWQLHIDLGLAHEARKEWAEAERHHREALARATQADGKDGSEAALAEAALGAMFERRGDFARSLASYRQAYAARLRTQGPSGSDTLTYAEDVGRLLWRTGHAAEALAHLEHTLDLEKTLLGDKHPGLASCLTLIARVELSLDRVDPARAAADQALAVLADQHWSDEQLAPIRFARARAISDPGEALALATKSFRALEHAPLAVPADVAEIRRWLASKGAPTAAANEK